MAIMRWWRAASWGLFSIFNAGCSVATLRLPSKGSAQSSAAPGKCKSVGPPVFDAGVAVLGLFDVIYANGRLDGENVAGVHIDPPPDEKTAFQIYRGIGYGVLGVFGASAIYGVYVHVNCRPFERQLAAEKRDSFARPARPALPASVYGLGFEMPEAAASATCRRDGRAWQFNGSVGLCRGTSAGSAPYDVRVSYRFGAPHEITVLYHAAPEHLNRAYDQLYASARKRYGKPQLERSALSSECAASLAQCLQNGERPTGSAWHWPSGTIELVPIWSEERALLELRHIREEAATP